MPATLSVLSIIVAASICAGIWIVRGPEALRRALVRTAEFMCWVCMFAAGYIAWVGLPA